MSNFVPGPIAEPRIQDPVETPTLVSTPTRITVKPNRVISADLDMLKRIKRAEDKFAAPSEVKTAVERQARQAEGLASNVALSADLRTKYKIDLIEAGIAARRAELQVEKNAMMADIHSRYQMTDVDTINLEDGTITRPA